MTTRHQAITKLAAGMGDHATPAQAAEIDARAAAEIRRRFGHLLTPPLSLAPDVRRRINDQFNPIIRQAVRGVMEHELAHAKAAPRQNH